MRVIGCLAQNRVVSTCQSGAFAPLSTLLGLGGFYALFFVRCDRFGDDFFCKLC